MIGNLLKNTELSQMVDFISPAFWQVVSPREIWRTGKQLVANYRDHDAFDQARATLEPIAERCGVELSARPPDGEKLGSAQLTPEQAKRFGESILRLYFAQLFESETGLLDLRPDRFSLCTNAGAEGAAIWSPRPYYLRWAADFRQGIRDLYRGFYAEDGTLFDEALEQLQLTPAKQAFVRQFGEGQEAVVFRTSHLVDSLHESFVCCHQAKKKLSGQFLAFGFYLTTLYQSLELLDAPLDVRGAFHCATSPAECSP
jgi:hypothetical protein